MTTPVDADSYTVVPFLPLRGGAREPAADTVREPEARVRLPLVCAASWAGRPVPRRAWHVDDLIPHGTVTLLAGDGGTGKSLLALQLAVATASGTTWLGREVARGPVLYLAAEDDAAELHRRVVTICDDAGLDIARLTDLHIATLAGRDALLATAERRDGLLRPTPLLGAVREAMRQHGPRLIIIDTLADTYGGDEIVRAQVRQFIGLLRGLAIDHDAAVLVLSHPSVAGMTSGTGTSGSTAWSNSVRSRLYLSRVVVEGAEPAPDVRTLAVRKSNYGRTGIEMRLRWRAGVFFPEGTPTDGTLAGMAAEARAERLFVDLLAAYTAEGRRVSPSPSTTYAPAVFARDRRAEGLTRPALSGAMNRLFAARRIVAETVGPASRRRSFVALAPASGGRDD